MARPAVARQSGGPIELLGERVAELQRELPGLGAFDEALAFEELDALEAELTEALEGLDFSAARPGRLALYRIAGLRIEHLTGSEPEERAQWAADCYQHARHSGYRQALARAGVLSAGVEIEQGRLHDARITLSEALEFTEKVVSIRPWLMALVADVDERTGRLDDAARGVQQARELEADVSDPERFRGYLDGLQGQIYLQLGLPDQAARWVASEQERVGALEPGPAAHRATVRSHLHRANLDLARDRWSRVVEQTEAWLGDVALYAQRSPWRASLLSIRGAALARLGERVRARAVLEEALERGPQALDKVATQIRLARVLRREGELARSSRLLEEAEAELEAQRETSTAWSTPLIETQLDAERARLALASGSPVEVLREERAVLWQSIRTRIELWRSVPVRRGGLGFLQHGVRRDWFEAIGRLDQAVDPGSTGAEATLEALIELQASGSLLKGAGVAPTALAQVRGALLGEGRGLLVYFPAPEGSALVALTRDTAAWYGLESDRTLSGALEDYELARAGALRQAPNAAEGEQAAAQRLAALLIPPEVARQLVDWTGVTIVGADLLGNVSFEVLAPGASERLGLSIAIDYLPTLPVGPFLVGRAERRSRPAGAADVLLFADPLPSAKITDRWPEAGSLELDESHCVRVLETYRDEHRRVVYGEAATPAALKEQLAEGPRVFQYLGHCVQDPSRERPALLVLSSDGSSEAAPGVVSCDTVEGLEGPALVVLTACRTTTGPARRGDEATGHLGGAWLAAGADAVLLSTRDLSRDDALALSRVFHERLAACDSPAEALRFAREELVRERGLPRAKLGQLQVLGLGQRPVFDHPVGGGEGRALRWFWIPVTAIVALVGLALGRRRRLVPT